MDKIKKTTALSRRQFLQLSSGVALSAGLSRINPLRRGRGSYTVGVGHNSNPYTATLRAMLASDGWNPSVIAGKRVIIKPNLVQPQPADTGITTDPEVVRAIVDQALAANAAEVWIVETGVEGAFFEPCGYSFFNDYDPRVSLVDLVGLPYNMAPVPNGLAYSAIALPIALFDDNAFVISVGKMKVHNLTMVSLASKNMFGFPPIDFYTAPPRVGRFGMHDRSVNESIVDLNLARKPDYAVVDGIWGLEGQGPWGGSPVRMDLVVAGDNALAVDYVCLMAMNIPAARVPHLLYCSVGGLGPAGLNDITIQGDPFEPVTFDIPLSLPTASPPQASPFSINPFLGEQAQISFRLNMPCLCAVEIVRAQPFDPDLPLVRQLRSWGPIYAGPTTLTWDGRDDEGNIALPATYGVRVAARSYLATNVIFAFGWVNIANPNG